MQKEKIKEIELKIENQEEYEIKHSMLNSNILINTKFI